VVLLIVLVIWHVQTKPWDYIESIINLNFTKYDSIAKYNNDFLNSLYTRLVSFLFNTGYTASSVKPGDFLEYLEMKIVRYVKIFCVLMELMSPGDSVLWRLPSSQLLHSQLLHSQPQESYCTLSPRRAPTYIHTYTQH